MDTSPNLTLPYIIAAQAQKHVTHNEALRRLDALVQLMVLDKDLSSPPGSPTDGGCYIVAASPSGAWSGQAGKLAAWQDGAWTFYAPREGWRAWVADEDKLHFWDGSAWIAPGSVGGAASAVGLHNGKIVESHASSAATYALKTLAGSDPSAGDPVTAIFPDGSSLSITAALSITIPSTATMGFASGVNGRIWTTLVNDGGTARLGVRNCRNGIIVEGFPAAGSLSSTAIDTAADNPLVTYTGAAVSAKPYILAAFADYDSGLTTAGTWDASTTRIVQFGPSVHKPGELIQKQRKHYTASATGTTTVPLDNTIPQNTEGDQYMDITVTPHAKQNILVVHAEPLLNATGSGQVNTTSIFQDSTANALASKYSSTELSVGPVSIEHTMIAGTTSATTFKMRSGGFTAGTTTFNGLGGSQTYGGVNNSFMSVEEYMA